MVGFSLSFKYLSSLNRSANGGQIRLRKPTTAYMLALAVMPSPTKINRKTDLIPETILIKFDL